MIDQKNIVQNATDQVAGIAKNVLVLARAAKITPVMFAKALTDSEANATYYAELVSEVVKTTLAEVVAKSKKDN